MTEEQSEQRHRHILSTASTGVALPMNTKYVAANPASQLLIRQFMATLIEYVSLVNPSSVLDIGCGEGLVVRQLRQICPDARIHGLDIAPNLIEAAQRIEPNASYVQADVCRLPVAENAYDLVICTEVLEHLPNPERALVEIARVGGRAFILSVPREPWWRIANVLRGSYLEQLGNTPGHVNHWGSDAFLRFLSNNMRVARVRNPFPWTMVLATTFRQDSSAP
jgi:ubiquinone/menaquinone biosynthesis C-methylase UbiE